MLAEHDAALVIGDPALQVDRTRYLTFDLAEEWIRFTGKPFVFAFWAVRSAALVQAGTLDLSAIFRQSRDNGLKPDNLNAIARLWGPRLGMTEAAVKQYLTENIEYSLDSETLDALLLFYRYACECGALPGAPALRFHEAPRPVSY
jgi:chorismate dehydratase